MITRASKTCSNCGSKKEQLSLGDRMYHCDVCGHEVDRDMNAALNLSQMRWATPCEACGAPEGP